MNTVNDNISGYCDKSPIISNTNVRNKGGQSSSDRSHSCVMNVVKKMACQLIDRVRAKELVQSIENVLFDCDGVLWNGSEVIPGSVATVEKLKQQGKNIFYVTNNSTKSRKDYLERFTKLGFDAKEEEIACTAYVAAVYLKSINFKGKIYLVGGKGIASELTLGGFDFIGLGADHVVGTLPDWVKDTVLDPNINCVLVGFDEHISYPKILKAASYLQRENCLFVATNTDTHLPLTNSDLSIPGTGAIVNAVKTAARREPIVLGKPNPNMFEILSKAHNLDPQKTLMVGDRINTDIGLAKNCGLKSMLVLSGVTTDEDLKLLQKSTNREDQQSLPDYYADYLGSLGEYI